MNGVRSLMMHPLVRAHRIGCVVTGFRSRLPHYSFHIPYFIGGAGMMHLVYLPTLDINVVSLVIFAEGGM
ncbi:hypothetical protein M408DRAFT_177362 [Serendipita vermifera MAFF 305830]|uniref:Uncharacterized protein n=1 Tax=Serendipita vermifera MAFF 305830 TaxID=933852 RepID=A0A0C3AQB2_SERVB|nr:hypothetical protein M408DRAFT_177362 [Serendipita vermifera MAFF 305830]